MTPAAANRTPKFALTAITLLTTLAVPAQAKPGRERPIHLEEARTSASTRAGPSVSPHPSRPDRPGQRVGAANALARIEPDRASWVNAIQQYAYDDGALYQVYTAPGQVTDIALQEGEALVGPGPVAAGDTTRWIIADTVSGSPAARKVHILLKPTRPDIATNLVINTDRRTYHLELRATSATYMAGVSWTYPADQLIALRAATEAAERSRPVAQGIEPASLNFGYGIDGQRPSWRPVRAFDDGRQTYIEFPIGIATGEMPPIFILGEDGSAELVNYRVQGRFMVVDRLFSAAELRLGGKKTGERVRIFANPKRKAGSRLP